MNARNTSRRDAGFTLPEMLISIVLTALMATVIMMTIVTSLRSLPSTSDRADSAVAVQGITTWLPPDVDSAEPGKFDVVPGTPSGCSGTDPGQNMLRLEWNERFAGVTTKYVADYRFIIAGTTGRIVRLTCSGVFSLGAPTVVNMSAQLKSTVPTVTKLDIIVDGLTDQVRISVETLSGAVVYINAASKNPHQTLPPVGPTSSTTSTTTTTTTAPNIAPTAGPVTLTANPLVPVAVALPANDPDGGTLTATVSGLPAGWTAVVAGLNVTITPDAAIGTTVLNYTVVDPAGASASSTITVNVVATATTTTTSTTTTTTTTTTTLPPCVISGMTVSPNPVQLQANGTAKLKKDVKVTITVGSGYCVGLTLQYITGGPNGQYIQNFGNSAPYTVTLVGHPSGTEVWTAGNHVLEVRNGANILLKQATLIVTN